MGAGQSSPQANRGGGHPPVASPSFEQFEAWFCSFNLLNLLVSKLLKKFAYFGSP